MKMVKLARCYVSKANQAKERGIEFDLSINTFFNLKKQTHCFYTGDKFNENNVLTLERIDNNKGYVDGNVIAVTAEANRMKSGYNIQELAELREKAKDTYLRTSVKLKQLKQLKEMKELKPYYNAEQFKKYVGLVNHLNKIENSIQKRKQIIKDHPNDCIRVEANKLKIKSLVHEIEANVKPSLHRLFTSAYKYKVVSADTTQIEEEISKLEDKLKSHYRRYSTFYSIVDALNDIDSLEGDKKKLLEVGLYNPHTPTQVSNSDLINNIVTNATLKKVCS